MSEKFRVYVVAVPDTEADFLAVTGNVIDWSEVTSEPVTESEAVELVSKVSA